jgi:hypothetical protein
MWESEWFFGLILVSGIIGALGSAGWYWLLSKLTVGCGSGKEVFDQDHWVTGVLTGVVERFFFTVIIATDLSGAAISMVAWITVKSQMHYKIFSSDAPGKDVGRLYLALLSSIASLLFAIAGGVAWRDGWTLVKFFSVLSG